MSNRGTALTDAPPSAIISDVIGRYFHEFARDPRAASQFYTEPTTMVLADRSLVLSHRGDIEAILEKSLVALRRRGYSHTTMLDPRTKLLNSTTALHGVIAVRLRTDGTTIEQLGVTFLLHKGQDCWQINAWIATDVDKLISP
jgi:hypothetical protein